MKAKTLNTAFKVLGKTLCGTIVAKAGAEMTAGHIVAFAASWHKKDGEIYVQIARFDNYRNDLREYNYCEIENEYIGGDNNSSQKYLIGYVTEAVASEI